MECLKEYIKFGHNMKRNNIENRLTVSNLAWEPRDDEYAKFVLQRYGINNIGIVCSKYGKWHLWDDKCTSKILDIYRGFNIVSMQAVLYGIPGDLVKNKSTLVQRVKYVSSVCEKLGSTVIVFGSPKTRVNISLDDLGEILESIGSPYICLEPNAREYGCECAVNIQECMDVVDGRPLCINFDTGNALMEQDECPEILDRINHIQISTPYLKPLTREMAHKLSRYSNVWENTTCRVSLEAKLDDVYDLPGPLYLLLNMI